jgi:hypothetical protein
MCKYELMLCNPGRGGHISFSLWNLVNSHLIPFVLKLGVKRMKAGEDGMLSILTKTI